MKSIDVVEPVDSERAIRDGEREDVVVYRDGRPVALVTPFDDDDLYWYRVEHDPAFIASIAEARAQIAAGQTVSHEELLREFEVK